MNRLTKRYSDNSGYDTIESTDGHGHEIEVDLGPYYDCVDKLGRIEDLMEKYNINDLVDLEIALDHFEHRFDNVQTKRVDNKETPMKRKNIVDKTSLNSYFICPKCKIKVSQMELYCHGCGQRLE